MRVLLVVSRHKLMSTLQTVISRKNETIMSNNTSHIPSKISDSAIEKDRTKLLSYKEDVKRNGENLLKTEFPSTILRLNTLLQTPQFTRRNFQDIRNVGDTPVVLCPPAKRPRTESDLLIHSNSYLIEIVDTVKPFMIKLVEDSSLIRMWVAFMIPKIEDGNNFGVEIQEAVMGLINEVENSAAKFYEKISGYYTHRADLVKKILKYPQIEDFKRCVWELDEKEYFEFCIIMKEIRNTYCALHDLFTKNIEKIKTPRTNHSKELLY